MSKQRQMQKKPASHFSPPSLASIQKNSSWLRSLSPPSPDVSVQQKSQSSSSDACSGLRLRGFDLTQVKVHTPSSLGIQAKLTIGAPGDKYEQEADRVANEVVSTINAPGSQTVQRDNMTPEDEDKDKLQMKPTLQRESVGGGLEVTPDVETSIQQSRGSGQPLSETVQKPMEKAFGVDFSGVRVHANNQSDQLNQSLQAAAFTSGQDIFFRQGQFNPGSSEQFISR